MSDDLPKGFCLVDFGGSSPYIVRIKRMEANMPVIDEKSREIIARKLDAELQDEVDIKVFTQRINLDKTAAELNDFTLSFIRELAEISSKIRFSEISVTEELARKHGISTAPSVMIGEEKGYRIIYNGAPVGYEATGVIETLVLVSRNDSGFDQETLAKIALADKETRVQVFVTPTCPYCPKAAVLAHRLSIASKGKIISECVEAQENPSLAMKFNVSSVPQQVINGDMASVTVGVQPEPKFVDQVLSYASTQYAEIHAKEMAAKAEKEKLPDVAEGVVYLTDGNFDAAVKKYGKLLVDCWAEWCGPCKMIAPVLEELAGELKGRVVIGKLNVDENPGIASRFNVMSIPTLMFFSDGEKVDELAGALPKTALKEKLQKVFKLPA
jgi:thioredoxin 1